MAKVINPSKLLPSAKSTIIGKSSFISPISISKKSTAIVKRGDDAREVGGKLVNVEKFLKSDLIVSQKKAEVKRKEKEKQDFSEAEKKLELPKISGFKLPKLPEPPSLGFFDRVKRFIFFTALGWALPKILEFLPKLEGFAKIIGGVYNFAEGLFGKLFDGFMSLVKFGGDLKDKTLGFIATAKAGVGGDYQKEFDKLEKQFNTFVNASIIAGVLAADIGGAAIDEYNKQKGFKGGAYAKGFSEGYAAGIASRGKGPRYRAPGEAAAGRTLAENVARQKLTRERMTAPSGPKGPLDRMRRGFRGATAQLETGTLFKRGAGIQKGIYNLPGKIKNIPQKVSGKFGNLISKLKGPFAKLKGPFARFAGVAVPGLGAAVGVADAAARFKAGDKIGGALASVSAALDVGTAATALTGIGLPIAGILGGISMGIDVILLIRDILRVIPFIPDKLLGFYKGGRVVRRYQGGGNTRGGRPVGGTPRRTINTARKRKSIKVYPPKSQPGKDVGGEKQIRKLYPDPDKKMTLDEFLRSPMGQGSYTYVQYESDFKKRTKKPNPYRALTGTAKILKEIPLVGGLMGAAVDIALGEKPDKKVYQTIASGIGNLVDSLSDQKVNKSMSSLMSQIKGFADGGTVPSRELKGTYSSMSTGDLIAKVLEPTIGQKVSEAINSIEKELMLRGGKKGGGPPGPGGGPGGGPSPTTQEQKDAFERIRKIAEKLGSPNPDITAAIAMWETGWLANPDSVYFASGKTNPFGQTGVGPKGFVIGKDGQKHKIYNNIEESVRDHLKDWKDVYKGKTAEEIIESIRQGGGRGMYNTNPGWTSNVLGVYNSIKQQPTKIIKGGPIKGGGIVNQRNDPDAEQTGIDISLGGMGSNIQNPFDNLKITGVGFQGSGSGESGSGYGNYVTGEVKIGGKKYEILLGHLDKTHVKKGDILEAGDIIGTEGISGRATGPHVSTHINALDGGDPQKILDSVENVWTNGGFISTDNKPAPKTTSKLSQDQRKNIQDALVKKGKIPFTVNGQNYFFEAIPNQPGKVKVFKSKNIFGYQEEVDVSPGKNTFILDGVKRKIDTMYPLSSSSPSTPGPGSGGYGGNMQSGGLIAPPKPNKPNVASHTPYNRPGSNGMIAIQPMIYYVEKPSSRSIDFPVIVPIAVNSSTPDLSSLRG